MEGRQKVLGTAWLPVVALHWRPRAKFTSPPILRHSRLKCTPHIYKVHVPFCRLNDVEFTPRCCEWMATLTSLEEIIKLMYCVELFKATVKKYTRRAVYIPHSAFLPSIYCLVVVTIPRVYR
jgi:hypothetical protein